MKKFLSLLMAFILIFGGVAGLMLGYPQPVKAATSYYVNDDSTAGDVYCTAVGDDANDGMSATTPKRTIQAIINVYDLGAGDIVYVDTGTYVENVDISLADDGAHFLGAGAALSTIDGNNTSRVINTTSLTVATKLEGFTITNGLDNHGAGMFNTGSSPTISNCVFSGNTATVHGGGMHNFVSTPVVSNCTFSGNSAANNGGGIFNNSPQLTITNCNFYGNNAVHGGGMYNLGTSPIITNCTFSNNTATTSGGGMCNQSLMPPEPPSNPIIANCILWGDNGGEIAGESPSVTYSNVQGGFAGTENINTDPLFVNAGGGDFHLQSQQGHWTSTGWVLDAQTSPCVDAGNPASAFSNEPLPNGGCINMGAYGNTAQASKTPPLIVTTNSDSGDDATFGVSLAVDTADGGGLSIREALNWASAGDNVTFDGGMSGDTITLSGTRLTIDKDITLDGDLDDDSIPDITISGNNTSQVIYTTGLTAAARLEGFTITNGYNEFSEGGGMYNHSSSLAINNCVFSNSASDLGGGMCNELSSPTISNCTFSNNAAQSINPMIMDKAGGGMFNFNSSSPTIIDCTFSGNTAVDWGGAIFNHDSSSPTITNCTFTSNSVTHYGGGGIYNYQSSPTITSCNFSGNSADGGGGIYNYQSSASMTSCNFSSNNADYGGGIWNYSSSPTISSCNFTSNTAVYGGGGIYNTDNSSPTINSCTFSNNTASRYGGGMYNSESTPTITGCNFTANTADGGGIDDAIGGGMYNYKSTPTITSCTFLDNAATTTGVWISLGGGITNIDSSSNITNCTFSGNSAEAGGGMYNAPSSPTLTNCTFYGNSATYGGGIYNIGASTPNVTNCILWGDTGGEVYNDTSPPVPSPVVTYCDVQGGHSGTGNIDANPLFANAGGGDYHLLPTSPCIDVGSNDAIPAGVTEDFEGDNRIIDGDGDGNAVVDVGVDETDYPAITSFTPTTTATGASVNITGIRFTGATAVKFGGTAASSFTVDSDTQITAVVGSGSSGKVTVITPGGVATSANDFTWVPTGGYAYFEDSSQSLGTSDSFGVTLGDVDGDGDLDAFVANYDSLPNKVWLNNGSGNFTDSGQSLGSSGSCSVALGDVDGDGDLDAFIANYSSPNKVWLNNGSGDFTDSGQSLTMGMTLSLGVALGDVDEDGDLDAFVTNFSSQPNRVWLNNGSGNFTDSGQSLGSSDSFGVALGDVDGDGDLDAFVANDTGQANKVWLNDGSGTFTDSGQSLESLCSYGVVLGDVDDDGDLDAFVANYFGQANKVWLNDGIGNFTDSGQSLGSLDSRGVALGDLDRDGDLDAFIANDTNQANKVWLNDGSGIFTNNGQSLGSLESYGVALGDVDGDGDFDAFVANDHATNKMWLNVVPPPPTITSLNPASAYRGSTVSVTITGTNLGGATAVSFGSGITTNSFTVDSPAQITTSIAIASSAAVGARDVSVTTPGGTATLTGGFNIPEVVTYDEPDYYLQMNLLGTTQRVHTSHLGRLDLTLEVTSTDSVLTLTIPSDTKARQENGNRLTTLSVSENDNPPPPPENKYIIGLPYSFEPNGATFDPPITLTFHYKHADIPDGVNEEDLVLAFYDEDTGRWVECACTCDPDTNCIIACIYHFTDFAIISPVPLPPAPAAFSLSGLSVLPAEIESGETITVSMVVANTGGEVGSYTAVLKIDGVKEEEKTVTIAAGGSQTVSFGITREEAGSYTVTVDGLNGSFTVVVQPTPTAESTPAVEEGGINWYIIGAILGVVLLLAIFLPIWIRRRKEG